MIDQLKFHVGPVASRDFRVTFGDCDVTELFHVKRIAFEMDADRHRNRQTVVKLELLADLEIEGVPAEALIVRDRRGFMDGLRFAVEGIVCPSCSEPNRLPEESSVTKVELGPLYSPHAGLAFFPLVCGACGLRSEGRTPLRWET